MRPAPPLTLMLALGQFLSCWIGRCRHLVDYALYIAAKTVWSNMTVLCDFNTHNARFRRCIE
jgi:hypothetical protein